MQRNYRIFGLNKIPQSTQRVDDMRQTFRERLISLKGELNWLLARLIYRSVMFALG